jgi:hypothetical protein
MLQKCYNSKTNTLSLDYIFLTTHGNIHDAEFKNIPKSRVNKYMDSQNYFSFTSARINKNKCKYLQDFLNNVHDYTFGNSYNSEIKVGMLPQTIIYLKFGDCFDNRIYPNSLPKNLISLTFGCNYNSYISYEVLPKSLTSLTFGYYYNKQIQKKLLPSNLIKLIFGHNYNQIILEDSLPENLRELIFGNDFNQVIEKKTLPKYLQTLKFGHNFNSEIRCQLPSFLLYLTFGHNYSKIIEKNIIPRNLKILYFYGSENNSTTINNLPEHIEQLGLYNLDSDVSNLSIFFKRVKIMCNIGENWDKVMKLKVPFGCIILDKSGSIINI